MRIITTIGSLLFWLGVMGQDSLYTSTDKPANAYEDNAVQTGLKFTASKNGKITALKFYKTVSTGSYTVTLWAMDGTKLTAVPVTNNTTGWQRIPVSIPVTAGQSYIVSVYSSPGRYGSSAGNFPRIRGSLTATSGMYIYGTGFPNKTSVYNYYVDVVFQEETATPLKVLISPDSIRVPYTIGPVIITGHIQGAVSYRWEVEDKVGMISLINTNTLTPSVLGNDSSGCSIRVFLIATDANGFEQAALCDVYIDPHPKQTVGIIRRDNSIFWLRKVIIIY